MTIRDLFNNSKGIAALLVRNGSTVLTLNGGGGAVPPNVAWFLGIVDATVEQRRGDRGDRIRSERCVMGHPVHLCIRKGMAATCRWTGCLLSQTHPVQP